LERSGISPTAARQEVADRFGKSSVAVRKWQEKYKNSPDYIDTLRWDERYHSTCKRMKWPIASAERILAAAKKDGKALIKVQMKPLKAPAKGK